MMGFDSGMHSLALTLQVFFLDLLLSGDNAIVIALACRRLPPQQMRQAILLGTAVAIGLRIFFTTIVTFLLAIPLLKLLGMLALIAIAIKLLIEEDADLGDTPGGQAGNAEAAPVDLWSTIGVIVVADVTMSLDNVVALAAVAQNSVFFLVLGLALSVPLLMYGSMFVTTLLKRYPLLVPAGGALLGWIAGDIGMSDPLIADWVANQLPGLTVAVPLACAIFVLVESNIIQKNMKRFPKPIGPDVMRVLLVHSTKPVHAMSVDVPVPPLPTAEPITSMLVAESADMVTKGDDSQPLVAHRDILFPSVFRHKGALYFLIALLAIPVPVVVGAIIYKSVINKGLMPPPTQLIRYECPGVQGSFYFYFRHGKDNVQIRSSSGLLEGNLSYGKIAWANFSGDTAVLGFTPPQELTYDDAKSVRLNGGSFMQINCVNKEEGAAAP